MPTNVGITTTCLLCSHTGRSDNIKRHVIKQHSDTADSDKIKLVGRIAVCVSVPYPETPDIKRYRQGVCLDCGTSVTKHKDDKNHQSLAVFQSHSCKAKQVRSAVSTPRAVSKTVDAAESVRTAPVADNYKKMYECILDNIVGMKVPESQRENKDKIRLLLRENLEINTDEDTEQVDYADALEQSFSELARLFCKLARE